MWAEFKIANTPSHLKFRQMPWKRISPHLFNFSRAMVKFKVTVYILSRRTVGIWEHFPAILWLYFKLYTGQLCAALRNQGYWPSNFREHFRALCASANRFNPSSPKTPYTNPIFKGCKIQLNQKSSLYIRHTHLQRQHIYTRPHRANLPLPKNVVSKKRVGVRISTHIYIDETSIHTNHMRFVQGIVLMQYVSMQWYE